MGSSHLRNSGGIVCHQGFALGCAFGAEALAIYTITGVYCVVYHQGAILDTLQYVTIVYFLPGAMMALLVGVFAKRILK